MSDCGCEGSCPVCRVGEVDDHKCDRCGVEFCPKCHGIKSNHTSENVFKCSCFFNKMFEHIKESLKKMDIDK